MISHFEMQWGLIISQFNRSITQQLEKGALQRLAERQVPEEKIQCIHVPGAVEIPLAAKLLAKTGQYHAIIVLGAIIQGETDHYTYVCQQVSYGCQQVMLTLDVPVIFGVLTTQNEQQAWDRAGGKKGNKGIEAVDAAMGMAQLANKLVTL